MDIDTAEGLIDGIYSAGMSGCGWAEILNHVADSLTAEGAWIVFAQPELQLSQVIAPRSNPEVIDNYQTYWWEFDPTVPTTANAPLGQIASLKHTGHEQFLASRFYNEFWRHSGHPAERLAANIHLVGASRISLGIQPYVRQESIDAALLNGFSLLMPHFCRAVEIHCKMRRLELQRDVARQSSHELVGLIDRNGRVAFIDDATISLITASDYFKYKHGCIELVDAHNQTNFLRLLNSCCEQNVRAQRGGALIVRDLDGSPTMRIEVMPFRSPRTQQLSGEFALVPENSCLVSIFDFERNRALATDRLKHTFNLTNAEAKVALELLHGDKRESVAQRLGVTLATIRTHMMHIFDKTSVRSRSELINRMLSLGIDPTTFS